MYSVDLVIVVNNADALNREVVSAEQFDLNVAQLRRDLGEMEFTYGTEGGPLRLTFKLAVPVNPRNVPADLPEVAYALGLGATTAMKALRAIGIEPQAVVAATVLDWAETERRAS